MVVHVREENVNKTVVLAESDAREIAIETAEGNELKQMKS